MKYILIATAMVLTGCGPTVPVIDLSAADQNAVAASRSVRVFELGQEVPAYTTVGDVSAFSCQNQAFDPPASKGDALAQLRFVAHGMGGDAVIDVTFDVRGTDTFGTNCWQSVQASGLAVLLDE